ncbi:response regulator transcription factor [Elusimicrobiota bacterium]
MNPLDLAKIKDGRLLLVIGNFLYRQGASYFMSKQGLNADIAKNAQSALELAEKNDYKLVVTEIEIPAPKDGIYLIKELQKRKPKLEVLIVSFAKSILKLAETQNG